MRTWPSRLHLDAVMPARFAHMIRKSQRLATMSPRELLYRLGREMVIGAERLAYNPGWLNGSARSWRRHLCRRVDAPPALPDLAAWWQRHMRTRQEPPFLLDAATLAEAAALYPRVVADGLEPLIQKADRVYDGAFAFLGIDFRVDDPIAWQRDPQTGRGWPSTFYADVRIPFCDGISSKNAAGDVKHVWELNRHEFLIDCAKAFYLTGDTRYAHRVFQIITHWSQANPYLQGVNWAGPLEVALRSLSWLWAYQFCRHWQGLPADVHLDMIKSFYRHGAYLYRHLEFYTSPNNHLVGEATALYLLGSFFPEFDASPAWRKRAWKVLEAEPGRQFYEDGGSTEQATSYHHYCLGFFLLVVLTRHRQGQPVPEAMRKRLEAALDFSMWMTTPDGTVPRIGDTDDARSIRFSASPLWDFRSLLGLGAVLFRRPDVKAVAGPYSEDALWLLGERGYRTYQELPAKVPETTSRVFHRSGYVILRSGWGPQDHHVCFDCGPIGLGLYTGDIPIFTHGHADLLSVTMSAFGHPLLVDAGFYAYNGSPDWHRYTRDVQGHNTVSIDGQSQAKLHVANAWSCVAEPGPIRWLTDEQIEFAEGSHSGFCGTDGRIRHRRAILWERGSYWVIRDGLEGEGIHDIEVFFHFAPGTARSLADDRGVSVMTDTGVHAVIQVYGYGTDVLRPSVRHGEAEPSGGWIATSYGQRVPAPLVTFHGRAPLPFTAMFILRASRSKDEGMMLDTACVRWLLGDRIPDAVAV